MTDRLVWVDIETTGLNPNNDVILEVALIVTKGDLSELIIGPNIVIGYQSVEFSNPEAQTMHESSGLLTEVATSQISSPVAEQQILSWLDSLGEEPGTVPMAGSSVHFDRKFLEFHMPDVAKWFHYRNADISAFNEYMQRWFPGLWEQQPEKSGAHRALADVQESIRLAEYYFLLMSRMIEQNPMSTVRTRAQFPRQ